jgi:nitrogen fixation/metabolism regulation signal transduction histidine kinase
MAAAIRRSRLELARSERLAAWRDAARRMAHEVKNPLAPIRMSVENLRRARDMAPERFTALFDEECRTLLEEVDALRRLVDEFSRFARLPEPRRQATDPAALLRHAVELYNASLDGVELAQHVEPGLPPARLDPDLMGQVLKNLLANALDAVPRPGGHIRLAACRRDGALVLSVSDNGPGLPPEVREHLFEPQVTTKRAGSGLGLAISRQIVEGHGGRFEVESSPTGAAFHVILPLDPPA